jgi:hypothetical protein
MCSAAVPYPPPIWQPVRLGRLRRLFQSPLLTFTISVRKELKVRPHQDSILDELFHAINQAIPVPARHEMIVSRLTGIREVSVCLWDRALIRDDKHAHPAPQDPERVDGVERLRSSAYLGDGQGAALSGSNAAGRQGNPVDLVLEDGSLA